MDDSLYGTRNKRGDWKPHAPLQYPPLFAWPARPVAFLKWLPEYLAPWNLFYALLAMAFWAWLTPSMETLKTLEVGWIAWIFARNVVVTFLFVGAWHLHLYRRKHQGTTFKYSGKWMATDNPAFLFKNQLADTMIWTFASGVPIWTAFEVVTLWCFANGYMPMVSFEEHPVYFVALLLAIPLFREVHFYLVHRLIHWPPLYRTVHKLHHNNVNPGPWSGLAMHPVEHLLYFSGVLIHFIVPAHPIHALFQLLHAGLSPAQGHVGFDKIVVGENKAFDTHSYAHYLHHRYFECNYADGAVPLDRWFGTFHDGTEEAHERMNQRFLAQKQKAT